MRGSGMKFGFSVVERIFKELGSLINDREGEDEEAAQARRAQIPAMLDQLYEAVVSKYRPIAMAVPSLFGKLSGDLMPIGMAFLKEVTKASNSPEFWALITAHGKNLAEQRFGRLNQYQAVGFTRSEAAQLLMTDILNMKALLAQVKLSGK